MAALQSHDTNRKWTHRENKRMGKRDKDLETEQDTQRQKHTQTTWTGISEGKLVMDDVLQSDCFIHQFNTNTQL